MEKANNKTYKQWVSGRKRENKNYIEDFQCWYCGKTITVEKVEPKERIYCDRCFLEKQKEHRELIKEYGILKSKVMYENAMRIMEKSDALVMDDYKADCEFVYEDVIKNGASYRSSYEIIVAIILYSNNYEYKINHPVDKYKVDFYIPELFTCLEVDGERHSHKLADDNNRDIDIRNCLGSKWEVIRIPTEYLNKDPEKIFEMIERARKLKQQYRSEPGIINPVFSRREQAQYNRILNKK